MATENEFGYTVAIQEMKGLLDEQYKSFSIVKGTAEHILGAASLIVALFGVLQVFNAGVAAEWLVLYNILLGVTGIAYLGLIVACIVVLWSTDAYTPIKADWDVLYDGFVVHTERLDVLKHQLSCYLNVINLNRPVIQRRKRIADFAALLLPIIVGLLFVLSLF